MKVLITGATGLIGSEIGQRLTSRGDTAVILVRDAAKARIGRRFPAEIYEWDHARPVPPEALEGVEAIIHLAGEPVADGRWTEKRKRAIRDSRVEGTRRLVEAARACATLKTFVQGSAVGIYGDRGDEVLDASSSPGEGFLAEVVKDWEKEAAAIASGGKNSVRLATVRTGIVLARHGGALAKMLPIFRLGVGGRLGFSGAQWFPWIHLEDIVGIFIHALDNSNVTGVLEGVAPEAARNRDFTTQLCEALDVIQGPPVPTPVLSVLYGEMATALFDSERVAPKATLASGYRFQFSELRKALRDILEPLKNSVHEKFEEQWVPAKPSTVWPYFCDEKNLESLTPPMLAFHVKNMSTKEIQEGTLIDYRLKLNGLPFRWRTRIEAWNPGKSFVDTQLKGPYDLWHHTHEFVPMAGGTLMRDRVRYRLPLGWLGNVSAGWKVVRDVDTIFRFRRKKIDEIFGA